MFTPYSKETQSGTKARQERKEAAKDTKSGSKTKKRSIKAVSTKNTYLSSTGERYTSAQVEAKIRKAKEQKNFESTGFCEDCGRNDLRITKSHIVSVGQAKKTGMVELCWSLDNILDHCEICHHDIERMPNADRMAIYLNNCN